MKKKKLEQYLFGSQTPTDPWEKYEQIRLGRISEDPGHIENPNTALMDNNIRSARAKLDSNKGINQVLDVVGGLTMNKGLSMVSGGLSEKLNSLLQRQETTYTGQGINDLSKGVTQFKKPTLKTGMPNLASNFGGSMAYGGEVGNKMVEIEGGETVEKADGSMFKGYGPNHEDGGLNVLLQEGSVVNSKRIADKKGYMSDKAEKRKKEESKLEKLLEKNGTDKLLKNTRERVLETNDMEKKQDLMLQSVIGAIAENPGENDKRPFGSSILEALNKMKDGFSPKNLTGTSDDYHGDDPYKYFLNPVDNQGYNQDEIVVKGKGLGDLSKGYMGSSEQGNMNKSGIKTDMPSLDSNFGDSNTITPEEDDPMSLLSKLLNGDNVPTGGDLLGLFAQYKGATEPMKNTLRARAGDTPNINAFKDYGKDGLKAIEGGKDYIEQGREDAEEDLRLSTRSARERGRNSSRSVNVNRALDIATEGKSNQAKDKIRSSFANQMLQLTGQEAQMENQQDQVVMRGEQQRDLADRQDRDNFFSNMAQDIAAKFENIQGIGNNLNSIKKRGDSAERIKSIVEASQNSNSLRELLEAFLKIDQGDIKVTKGKKNS